MQPTKADNRIEEEHLLNFVVNSLNGELPIDLGEDVEVSTEDLGQSHLRIRSSLAESHLIRHRCNYLSERPGGEYDLHTTGFGSCESDTKSVSL